MPLEGSKRLRRSSPASTTTRTPSMVRLVSAMLVASTILRRPGFRGPQRRVLFAAGELTVERQHVDVRTHVREHSLHAPDLARARQEHQHVSLGFGERTLDYTQHRELGSLASARQHRHAAADMADLHGKHAPRRAHHRRIA